MSPLPAGFASALDQSLRRQLTIRGLAVSAPPRPDGQAASEPTALDRARGMAAVVGVFDPLRLVMGLSSAEQVPALNQLARESTEEVRGDRVVWALRPESRREALALLAKDGELARLLERMRPQWDDRFGVLLQESLRGKRRALHQLSLEDLTLLHTATEFAAEVRPEGPSPEPIRRELARRSYEQAIGAVLPRHLVGRRREVNELIDFVRRRPSTHGAREVIVVTGVGGSGKSTVLAAAIRRLQRGARPPPVILLDFDRPMLGPHGTLELTFELSRQLGLAAPKLETALSALRRKVRRELRAIGDSGPPGLATDREWGSSSVDRYFLGELRGILSRASISKQPLALVLDTFEEIAIHGPESVHKVLAWVDAIREESGLTGTRTIISGRAIEESLAGFGLLDRVLRVEDLSSEDAARLLTLRGVPQQASLSVASSFGGNPLVLRLVADFLRQHPEVDANELAAGGRRKRLSAHLRLGLLYRRILQHVHQEDLRQLANPGLALRRVTPDLITEVLAEPCGLGPVPPKRARALFDGLASQVWLVERRSPEEVFHRRDLRQIMLPLISQDKSALVRRIHRAAAAYYAERRDPQLEPDLQEIEETYHRLLAGDQRTVPSALAKRLATVLGGDVAQLPLKARAQVKAELDRQLTAEELGALPLPQRLARVERELRVLLAAGDALHARAYLESALRAGHRRRIPPDLRVAVYWGAGDFARARTHAIDLAREVVRHPDTLSASDEGDATEHPLWLATVLNANSRTAKAIRFRRRLATLRPPSYLGKETCLLLASAAALTQPPGGGESPLEQAFRSRPLSTRSNHLVGVIGLRYAAVGGPRLGEPPVVRLGAMTLLRSDTIRAIRRALRTEGAELIGITRRQLTRILDWLHQAPGQTRLSLRRLESAVRQLSQAGIRLPERGVIGMPFSQPAYRPVVRGITPEFRAPVLAALADAFPTESAKAQLARMAQRIGPVRPLELAPARFARAAQRDPRRWLPPLLDIADRGGYLHTLLARALVVAPRHQALAVVDRELRRFERKLATSLTARWKERL